MIAALYVDPRGCYAGLEGVDLWDESRDARQYAGPWPVVAHPPCTRWCRLAAMVEARYPHCRRGDDGGTFAAALASVRRFGGVLEHPAYTDAWAAHGLLAPPSAGGWVRALDDEGWVCHVEQGHYGHPARKATWLYAVGVDLPRLIWGRTTGRALVGWAANHVPTSESRPRVGKSAASATPPEFRDILISMARSARP